MTRRHNSTVNIKIFSGPLQFEKNDFSVSKYLLEDDWAKQDPQAYSVFKRMIEIANSGNEITTIDSDYGAIPEFYVRLNVGEWDKPYTFKLK